MAEIEHITSELSDREDALSLIARYVAAGLRLSAGPMVGTIVITHPTGLRNVATRPADTSLAVWRMARSILLEPTLDDVPLAAGGEIDLEMAIAFQQSAKILFEDAAELVEMIGFADDLDREELPKMASRYQELAAFHAAEARRFMGLAA